VRLEGPLWVIGTISPYGEICARVLPASDCSSHTEAEKLAGRPFRWNIVEQEWHAWDYGDLRLSEDERYEVEHWLEREGWKDTDD
jgi:hypothetical protein